MPSLIISIFLGAVGVYGLLWSALHATQHSKEPPPVEDGIPFLGPIISMITQKTNFYVNLRKKHNLAICTLRLPAIRVYVVNATDLIPVLQKQWRLASFTPIMAKSGPAVLGMSQAGADILHKDMKSDTNVIVSAMPIMNRVLAPGPSLDSMNRRAVEVLASSMTDLRARGASTIKFWEWAHHEILMATTESVYGPQNPFRKQVVEDAWNTFEPAYLGLALSPFKPLTAAKAYRAREFLVSAWRDYITAKGPEEASAFINATHAHNASHGFCLDDLARFEVGHSFAIIASTAPTAWWLMYHIFSDETVLKDVRGELSALVEITDDGKSRIDLASVRDSCPILLSTFKETMRYRAIGNAVRVCLEDTWLEDRVLLKKGSAVIMPQVVFHTEEAAWGPDSHVFDHLRFVRSPDRRRPNPVAFRAFGGGHNLCPGRHFSSTEILASAALLVLLFDVTPKSGKWVEPTWDKTPMVFSFQLPDEDIDVDLQPRDDREWDIVFSGSNSAMSIVSEDMKAD